MDGFGDLADFDLMDGLDDMNEYDSDNMDVMGIRAKYNNIAGFDIMAESDLDEFEDKDDSDRMEVSEFASDIMDESDADESSLQAPSLYSQEGVTNGPPYGEALPPVTCAIRFVTFENLTGNYGFTSRIFAGCAHSLVGFEAWTLSVDEHFEPLDPLL
ncbi:uncharacterized protein EAF01_003002 [Botrytis porri]|uniref:uncharacterized protein n=1 Tax=Botrytis porri TaxID=87229 RepID=UPI001901C451|nr:uncharacterized protein EAF01_003002 [Botrytis porri]KAF7909284.1 hypothetical protein EAF01_003002 [Botrytis porri]